MSPFMDLTSILGGLNAAQAAAVTAEAPVVQILAPPGSGKTKTLTSRVAYLLSHHDYKPWNTLCLTFTIKSAREMKERISKLVGDGVAPKIVLGTFHSVCRRYLVTYGHLIDLKKGFGIADSTDSLNIIKRIVKRRKVSMEPAAIRSRISSSKAKQIGYEELRREASAKKSRVEQQDFILVFEEYESHLAISNLLDYDDLLLRCVSLLQAHPECVSNVEAVLIDEFQDTNSVQFELMRLFAARHHRITTVGDPDQSIYGWRSAEIKNLKKMQRLYPDTLVLNLESNYRSSGAILAAAREVIEQDTARPSKPLLATHCHGTYPVLRKLPSSYAEAAWIVSEIRRCMTLTGGKLVRYSDFAILLRSAALSRQIESALGRAGMPYRMVGGARFFDRVEIKILLNYLRVIASPNNSEAFSAIINVPPRRIGETTTKALLEEARAKGVTLFALIRSMSQGDSLTTKLMKPAEQGLGSLLNIILTARKKLAEEATFYPTDVLAFVLKRLEFNEYLKKAYPEDEDSRWANVEELVAQASDPAFSLDVEQEDEDSLPSIDEVEQRSRSNPTEEALTKFLANVALSTELQMDDEDPETPQHRIVLSTIHAAKGLEWPVVFIPSAYHGSIPHSRAEDNDEERRLLYVAMTRAQALLYVSQPLRNSTTGDETAASPFLEPKCIQRRLCAQGPSLRSETIQQIAHILGREVPSEELINAGLVRAENLEDDLWTAEGEEQKRGFEDDEQRSYKRRRVENEHVLLRRSESAGFVTASTHLSTIQDKRSEESQRATQAKSTVAAKKSHGQGTLTSLWAPPMKPTPGVTHDQPAQSAAPLARHDSISQIPARLILQRPTYPPHTTSTRSAEDLPLQKYTISRTGFSGPKVSVSDGSTPYVFLSSSPPPEPALTSARGALANPSISIPAASTTAVHSATTFHNTSMQQLHAPGAGVKKSLGMRRSVAGWSSQPGPKPFAVPRRTGV